MVEMNCNILWFVIFFWIFAFCIYKKILTLDFWYCRFQIKAGPLTTKISNNGFFVVVVVVVFWIIKGPPPPPPQKKYIYISYSQNSNHYEWELYFIYCHYNYNNNNKKEYSVMIYSPSFDLSSAEHKRRYLKNVKVKTTLKFQ